MGDSTFTATVAWAGNQPIVVDGLTPSSSSAPALAVYHGYLYVLYATSNSDSPSLWQATYSDSDGWAGNTQVSNLVSLCRPALAELNGVLYMAYVLQPSKSDDSASIVLASLTWSKDSPQPLPSTSWVSLTNTNAAPVGDAEGLAMVAFNGQLWIFYNHKGSLCLATTTPGDTVTWDFEGTINDWTSSLNPQITGGPAAAILSYTNSGGQTQSAPYIVYNNPDGVYHWLYYDPSTNAFVGDEFLGTHNAVLDTNVQSELDPCLIALPSTYGFLAFKGDTGTSVNVSFGSNGTWYGDYAIKTISKLVGGPEVNPTTVIGMGAALLVSVAPADETAAMTLMMVYPSASSQDNIYLYWASLEVTVTTASG